MSSSSSFSSHAVVNYTSVSTENDLPPWGFHLMEAYKPEAQEVASQSPNQAPLSPVPAPEYLEYLAPSDDDIPVEDQPLPTNALPTACSPGYIADSEPIEDDSKEDPEMDLLPLSLAIEARITEYGSAPTSPLPLPSPLSPQSSPLPMIPSSPLLLPSPTHRDTIPEADMPPQKRARFTAPS
uniref:Uncharacterized protein n=1 Tax=Tanacetum cinerariifolium TaxID=118510 RepID=A0A6L2LBE6_TANCI|nr:hypothetical protein [Tanacetum cinerariifolium]